MRITSDQKVGIGTSNPTSKLSVNGDVQTGGMVCSGCIDTADIAPYALQLGTFQVTSSPIFLTTGETASGHAVCNPNQRVTGGGFQQEYGEEGKLITLESRPSSLNGNDSWFVTSKNTGATSSSFVVIAICASIGTNPSVTIPIGSATPGCELTNQCFKPASININTGQTVVWKNADIAAHTVTSGNPTAGPDGEFDSSLFGPGLTFSHTFITPGTFDYFDVTHPWQIGKVIVS